MVKLASARESRMYGPRSWRNKAEYINAGLYMFATIMLLCGFAAEFSREPKSGLVLLLIALELIMVVNIHDLLAHLAGFDYWFPLMEFDIQLALVEFAVPVVQILGTLLMFLAILFLFIQKHALNTLIAGTVLWVLGSIHNSCQIYERADGHVQILQKSVHIPFLMGSLLFMVGAILSTREQAGFIHHATEVLVWNWVWLGIIGSLLFFFGGLMNVVKVFKMQQIDGLRLEKLRGGAHEWLMREREGHVLLIIEEQRIRKKPAAATEEEAKTAAAAPAPAPAPAPAAPGPTPYKDVFVGQT